MTASATEHPDLFWALKGGGGNFGVITSMVYRLHPVGPVLAGMILHPLMRAREVLRCYRDFVMAGMPDELTVYATAITSSDGTPMIAIIPAYTGADLAVGERLLAPLRACRSAVADLVTPMPYLSLQRLFDAAAPFGVRSYWKSTFLRALPDDAIDTFVQYAAARTSRRTVIKLEHAHGAATRVPPDATAFPAPHHAFQLVVLSLWEDPEDDARNVAWTREFDRAMRPWSAPLVYVNALAHDDGTRVRDAYGDNYARLAQVKTRYDPANRFRRNHNIAPVPVARSSGV